MEQSSLPIENGEENSHRSWVAQAWSNFDIRYLKPALTKSTHPTLLETLPGCCMPVAKCFSTEEQITSTAESWTLFVEIVKTKENWMRELWYIIYQNVKSKVNKNAADNFIVFLGIKSIKTRQIII